MSCNGGLYAAADASCGPSSEAAVLVFLSARSWFKIGLARPLPCPASGGAAFCMSLLQLLQARMLVVRQLLPPLPVLVRSSLPQLPWEGGLRRGLVRRSAIASSFS